MHEPMPRDTITEAVSDHRAERDRFAAFALAAADLLIEVNGDQRIVYVAGAARAFTRRDARQLIGSPLHELFVETHPDFSRTPLRPVRRDPRIEPLQINPQRGRGG